MDTVWTFKCTNVFKYYFKHTICCDAVFDHKETVFEIIYLIPSLGFFKHIYINRLITSIEVYYTRVVGCKTYI